MNKPDTTYFDYKLAAECANAFYTSTGLGCTVSNAGDEAILECGACCSGCRLRKAARMDGDQCARHHMFGRAEAGRCGGRYTYFCPLGLTFFASPIIGGEGAAITVGPFLMVEKADFIAYELSSCIGHEFQPLDMLGDIPYVSPEKVNALSTLLFMAVGFLNNVSAANKAFEERTYDDIRGRMTSYILRLKEEEGLPSYPFEAEQGLIDCLARGDLDEAHGCLNELYSYILYMGAGNLPQAKTRVHELLALISRAVISCGADPGRILQLNHEYHETILGITDIDSLCLWLSKTVNSIIDSQFRYVDARHANIINKAISYMQGNYASRITLEETSQMVYLSPAYFSRMFKQETGITFNTYLNNIRIEKAAELLRHDDMRLTDIAHLVGFKDQSYFTRVFKRTKGVSPLKYKHQPGG